MALTPDQELREHELRIDQMTVNIEKLRSDIRYESRKFGVQLVVGTAACIGVGVALATYVNNHAPTPPPTAVYVVPAPAAPPAPAGR